MGKFFFLWTLRGAHHQPSKAGFSLQGLRRFCEWLMGLHAARVSMLLLVLMGLAHAARPIEFAVLMPAPDIKPAPELPRSAPATKESELHPARRALALKPVHDETNPGFQQLQRIDEATSHLPHDALGFPDWMASLRSGAITPLAGLDPSAKMNVLDLDVVMKNTKEMPNVLFPHRSHTLWLDCSNCHPAPFVPKAGANQVSMGEIFRGRYCGMCHDRVAFITFFSCARCHSVTQGSTSARTARCGLGQQVDPFLSSTRDGSDGVSGGSVCVWFAGKPVRNLSGPGAAYPPRGSGE